MILMMNMIEKNTKKSPNFQFSTLNFQLMCTFATLLINIESMK